MNRERQQEIDALVEACIKQDRIEDAREAVKLGASQQELDAFAEACIKQGRVGDAREAARMRARELTVEEIILLRKAID